MKVIIKGTEYEYEPDYPAGWNSSSPITFFRADIGSFPCFVKRLVKKDSSFISGWDLLVGLKKKDEPNLARIYDIKSVEEKGKRVYYLFYEYLIGVTLGKLIEDNVPIVLTRLTNDLFQAIASLRRHHYWFADFFEKNIFFEESGRFVLVDLDSAQPISKLPADDMDGSKNYWGPVFNFYTKILGYKNLKKDDLSGLTLNHLQIIFLILRLKILAGAQQEEGSSGNLVKLHFKLDEIDPSFKELFIKIYSERNNPQHVEDATEIQELIIEKIIGQELNLPGSQMPVIKRFTSNIYIVGKGEDFELSWEVNGAAYVELYEDGAFDAKFTSDETSTKKTAFYDGVEETVSYKLIAYKGNKKSESASIDIKFKEIVPKPPKVKIEKFAASTDMVKNGASFELSWEVVGAVSVTLYKNGALDTKFTSGETSVKKVAYQDGNEKLMEYTLIASGTGDSSGSVEKKSLVIKIIGQKPPDIEFTVNNYLEMNQDHYVVESGKPFILIWNVSSAREIEIQQNGQHLTTVKGGEGNIEIIENVHEGNEKIINYTLSALFPGTSETTSKSLPVTVKPEKRSVLLHPVIQQFKSTKYVLRNGGSFILNWNVQNASEIELYKNEELFKTFSGGEKNIELEENYEGIQRKIKYTLQASNAFKKAGSEPVIISVKPPVSLKMILIVAAALVALIALYFIVAHSRHHNGEHQIVFYPFTPGTIKAGDTITITGKDLPESDNFIEIKFNDVNGNIVQLAKDEIRVQVPKLMNKPGYVNIVANAKNNASNPAQNVIYHVAQNIPYIENTIDTPSTGSNTQTTVTGQQPIDTLQQRPNKVPLNPPKIYSLSSPTVTEGETIIISGANLPQRGNVVVKFNDVAATIVKQKPTSLTVRVPTLPPETKQVMISVLVNGKALKGGDNIGYQHNEPAIIPIVRQFEGSTVIEGNYIDIHGENLNKIDATVKFNDEPAKIITRNPTVLRVQVPSLRNGVNKVSISVLVNRQVLKAGDNIIYKNANAP